MKIAEGLILLPRLEAKVDELRKARQAASTVSYDELKKEEILVKPEVSVYDLTEQINGVCKVIRELKRFISYANTTNTIAWELDDAKEIFLGEGVTLLNQMEKGQDYLTNLGNIKTTSKVIDPYSGGRLSSSTGPSQWAYKEITEASFDTKIYKAKAEQNQKGIAKLKALVQAKNWEVEIPFEYEG